jgi:membrane protease YdiL (CAAX protease family)
MQCASRRSCSIAVFVAGLTWSWIYARSASIWSAWASHALVDIAVFWAGWQILFVQ